MPPPSHLAFSIVVVLHTPKTIFFLILQTYFFHFVSAAESSYHGVWLFDSQLRHFLKARWVEGLDRSGRQLIGEINAPHRGHK